MSEHLTGADFERLSWHDCTLYSLRIDVGDYTRGDWRSELVLDIDFIAEWVKEGEAIRFRIAPATLTFHDATDLKLDLDWGDSSCQNALSEASISEITRTRLDPSQQKICLDRPYYRWRIELNWPKGGIVTFGASSFTQKLRAEPLTNDEQKLSPSQRGES